MSSSEEEEKHEGSKVVKGLAKFDAHVAGMDDKMAKGKRKNQRACTVQLSAKSHLLEPDEVGEKRSHSLPDESHRRGDLMLNEESKKILMEMALSLQKRISQGAVPSAFATDEVLRKTLEERAHTFVFGKMTPGQNPADEREHERWGGDYPAGAVVPYTTCIKGSKGAMDRNPNQDNFSVAFLKNGYTVGCVMDGHGADGHRVASQAVKTVPYYLTQSRHFPGNMPEAFMEAFDRCQSDLVAKALKENWDALASGSTAAVAVWKDDQIWTGHAGDSRIVVGTEASKRVVFETLDHKPEVPEERARLKKMGSEVRSQTYDDGVSVHRVFIRGRDFPGLCMSRSLGDASSKEHGIIAEPEVRDFTVNPKDSPFMILASDGVWEFLSSGFTVKAMAKKMPTEGPEKTLHKLQREARKRWRTEEGEYCDDITAMLIRF